MTDDELDLLASAYLDGEATPEEVALVERDPALQARVEEFRTLGGGLADTPAPSPALRQAHLTAALAEFGTLRADAPTERMGTVGPARDGSASDGATGDRVVDLRDRASARRRGPQRSLPSWLPAASQFEE